MDEIGLEAAIHNTIFQCKKDQQFYDARKKRPYLVTEIAGFKPGAPGVAGARLEILEVGSLLCEECFNDLGLPKKPSPIIKANPAAVRAIKEGSIHGGFH